MPSTKKLCRKHGVTDFVLEGRGHYRCRQCRADNVKNSRRRLKDKLIDDFGGQCVVCGYSRYRGALQFHHKHPQEKSFGIGNNGKSYEDVFAEASKCILVCSNCHAEIEAGVIDWRYYVKEHDMHEDPRKTGLKNGLRQLTIEQLERVISYPGEMVLNTYNYEDGKFCPLAVALELDKTMVEPTHDKVFGELTARGYKVYNTRGIKGDFYKTDRRSDLLIAAQEVLREKFQDAYDLWDEIDYRRKMKTALTRYRKRHDEELVESKSVRPGAMA